MRNLNIIILRLFVIFITLAKNLNDCFMLTTYCPFDNEPYTTTYSHLNRTYEIHCHCITHIEELPSVIYHFPPDRYVWREPEAINVSDEVSVIVCEGSLKNYPSEIYSTVNHNHNQTTTTDKKTVSSVDEQTAFGPEGLSFLEHIRSSIHSNSTSNANAIKLHKILVLENVHLPHMGMYGKAAPDYQHNIFTESLGLTHLVLLNPNVESIPPTALLPLKNSLEVITISERNSDSSHHIFPMLIKSLNFPILSRGHKNSSIKDVNNNYPLQSINVHLNDWPGIASSETFDQFEAPNLQHLTLSGLMTLSEDSFKKMKGPKLKSVSIITDHMDKIPWKALGVFNQTLEKFAIQGDLISTLTPSSNHVVGGGGTLEFLKLKHLDINDALALNEIPTKTFSQHLRLPNLQTLNIIRNNINEIGSDAFTDLPDLITLDMSHNNIGRISKDAFNGLTKLQTLNLQGSTMVKEIEDRTDFSFAHSLKTLLLTDSLVLQKVPKQFLASLKNLQILDLSNNKIAQLWNDGSIIDLDNLQMLNLAHNRLQHMPYVIKAPYLETLDLSYNNINMIEPKLLLHMPKIKTLRLQGNRLRALPFETNSIHLSIGSSLVFLGLKDNPWDCNCNLKKVLHQIVSEKYLEMTQAQIQTQNEELENAKCHSPPIYAGLSLVAFESEDICIDSAIESSNYFSIGPISALMASNNASITNNDELYRNLTQQFAPGLTKALKIARRSLILTSLLITGIVLSFLAYVAYEFWLKHKNKHELFRSSTHSLQYNPNHHPANNLRNTSIK